MGGFDGAVAPVIALQKVYQNSGQRGRKNPASGKPETGFAARRRGLVDPGRIELLTSALRSPLRFYCNFVQFVAIGFAMRFIAVSVSTYFRRSEVIFAPFLGLVSTKSQQNLSENI
ncbi:MAG TPA: hypothetical protein DDX72_02325 [Ruminococcaceae bacterium]|nr:hypothetical protein [Oscillospiraceae bacterium]